MPKFIVDLWLDGYESEEEMREACAEFIHESLNMTASSVGTDTYNPESGPGLLIEAMLIFDKYTEDSFVTHCEHDVMWVCIDPRIVSDEDKEKLNKLHFSVNEEDECFKSYWHGSA